MSHIFSSSFIPSVDSDLYSFFGGSQNTLSDESFALIPGSLFTKRDRIDPVDNILIKDPPRARLTPTPVTISQSPSFDSPLPSPITTSYPLTSDVYITTHSIESQLHSLTSNTHRVDSEMAKKRRSLQSIFLPTFLSSPPNTPASTSRSALAVDAFRQRSHSVASHPYPLPDFDPQLTLSSTISTSPEGLSYLIDDDPFANLSGAPSDSLRRKHPLNHTPTLSEPAPRSPLSPIESESLMQVSSQISTTTSTSPMPKRSRTMLPLPLTPNVRPAYSKPAFAPRPSLPSLHTLSKMSVVIPKKARHGKVGAKLPSEPWDLETSANSSATDLSVSLPMPTSSESEYAPDLASEPSVTSSEHSEDPVDLEPSDAHSQVINEDDQDDKSSSDYFALSALESPPPLTRSSSYSVSSISRSLSSGSETSTSSASGSSKFSQKIKRLRRSIIVDSINDSMSSTDLHDEFLAHSSSLDHFAFPSYSTTLETFSDTVPNSMSNLALPDAAVYMFPSSIYPNDDNISQPHNPGSTPHTIRASIHAWSRSLEPESSVQYDEEVVDGSGWEERQSEGDRRSTTGRDHGSSDGNRGLGRGSVGSGNGHGGFFGGSGQGGGREEDDEGHESRQNRAKSSFSTPSSSDHSASEDDIDDNSGDEYGLPSGSTIPNTPAPNTSGSDDDVPLAQQIPNALQAQRSIRNQVREERDQRRKQRSLRQQQASSPRSRQTTLRPGSASGSAGPPPLEMTSSQESPLIAMRSITRGRTQTLSNSAAVPFTVEDLTKRLNNFQTNGSVSSPTQFPPDEHATGFSSVPYPLPKVTSQLRSFERDQHQAPQREAMRTLRPMRSFHKMERRTFGDYPLESMPEANGKALNRGVTRAESQRPSKSQDLRRERSRARPSTAQSLVDRDPHPMPREEGRKPSLDAAAARSSRPSNEVDRNPHRPSIGHVAPVEALANISQPGIKIQTTQQRVFIGDMQRFNTIEIGPTTTARDVVGMVEAQGTLKELIGSGGWMLWEVCLDFGMERPIRSFELLSDVSASWNKDKTVNTFILKLTPLAPILSRSAIPTSSPKYAGYVEWESKRGKWSKRWLQLREHSLWISKRDNGKDQILLCSLSNFDAYSVTRLLKAPKSFTFAIKSTDNLSFFENTADYLHVFSCDAKEGNKWMESILLARSYVLFQERNVLFASKPVGTAPSTLARSGTRKQSISQRTQPLVNPIPPSVFEPGSLLHKHA